MTVAPAFTTGFGPYLKHPPVRAFCDLSQDAFTLFHEAIGGHVRSGETPRQHLTTRMLYISENTSAAIRLNVTWGLSLPAMSLVRDRYEQVVRHSWLMHQSDNAEMVKYLGYYYAKLAKIYGNLDEATQREFVAAFPKGQNLVSTKPTADEKKYLERWDNTDLHTMVQKRDKLLNDAVPCRNERELGTFYTSIYRQFSSITHFDMYAMNIVGLHPAPDGTLVLAPDPFWPAMLSLHTSLFDLIQCSEACKLLYNVDRDADWASLFDKWNQYCQRIYAVPSQASAASKDDVKGK